MKYIGYIMTNKIGSKCEFEFEIDEEELDLLTEEDIDDLAKEAAFQNIEWNYKPRE